MRLHIEKMKAPLRVQAAKWLFMSPSEKAQAIRDNIVTVGQIKLFELRVEKTVANLESPDEKVDTRVHPYDMTWVTQSSILLSSTIWD